MRHHLFGDLLDGFKGVGLAGTEVDVEHHAVNARFGIGGKLVDHLSGGAHQNALPKLLSALGAGQGADHACVHQACASIEIVEPAVVVISRSDLGLLVGLILGQEPDA